ncbi:RDD family protein [Mycolicibacterium brisbanense]|uniref:RDD domain-containing protein n=1 Tax=Mycolicibacterium brisbanense TaxID=146020 RepID=A0A100VZB6_9MYCO|nr:RDD family protein [Mycolicibacterium brisbanense]MCV7158810.1 RDD family protein [Mycolicibacterium brisbanense]GAS88661.1 RDD domain-containing protein [Mycolicibacterium brisbanense]
MPGQPANGARVDCPNCGSALPVSARFCGTCGYTVQIRSSIPNHPWQRQPTAAATVDRIQLAGRGVRCSAFLLDIAAMISPALPLAITGAALGVAEVIYIVVPVAFVAVWAWLQIRQGLTGNTFGKSMMGLRVVRATDNRPPGLGPSIQRSMIFVATCGLAALPVLAHRPGLHDRASGLAVLDVTTGANPLGPRRQAALRRSPDRGLNQVRSPIPHPVSRRG